MTSATTPPEVAGIERVIDTILLALAKAHYQRHVVGVDDIEKSVVGFYAEWTSDEVVARLSRGPCSDDCPLAEGMEHTATVLGRALIEHIAVEVDLLIQIQEATGKTPAEALREVRERAERAVNDAE